MRNLGIIGWISYALVILGGLNWGLVGISSKLNLAVIFLGDSFWTRIAYIIVGLAALHLIYLPFRKR